MSRMVITNNYGPRDWKKDPEEAKPETETIDAGSERQEVDTDSGEAPEKEL